MGTVYCAIYSNILEAQTSMYKNSIQIFLDNQEKCY